MQRIARAPGSRNQLNDEAHLTDWGSHYGCYCGNVYPPLSRRDRPRAAAGDRLVERPVAGVDRWRLEELGARDAQIAEAVRQANPQVLLSSQFDPQSACGAGALVLGVDIAALAEVMDLPARGPLPHVSPARLSPRRHLHHEHVRYLRGHSEQATPRLDAGLCLARVLPHADRADGAGRRSSPALGAEACTATRTPRAGTPGSLRLMSIVPPGPTMPAHRPSDTSPWCRAGRPDVAPDRDAQRAGPVGVSYFRHLRGTPPRARGVRPPLGPSPGARALGRIRGPPPAACRA